MGRRRVLAVAPLHLTISFGLLTLRILDKVIHHEEGTGQLVGTFVAFVFLTYKTDDLFDPFIQRRVKSEPRDVSKPMKAEPVVLGPLPSIGLRTAYRSRSEGALAVFQARSRASTAASRCSKRARSGSLIRRTPALQTAFRRHVHNINSGITSSHAFSRSDVSQTLSPARSLRHPSVRTANSEPNTTPGLRYGPAPLLPSRTGTAQTVARSHPDTEVIVDEDVEEGSVVEDDEEDDEDVQIVACRTSQGSVALGNGRTRSQQAG